MSRRPAGLSAGVAAALASALAFGASTPVAKLLLAQTSPTVLAGLLYLGAGLGLAGLRAALRRPAERLSRHQWRWFAGAVVSGGVLAPLALLTGLAGMPASGASLLLNAEVVATAALAWLVFGEHVDRRVGLGMVAITAGAVVLAWPHGEIAFGSLAPAALVVLACLLWALDNNLTRQVSTADATWLAMVKGLVAGTTNTALGLGLGGHLPDAAPLAGALLLGFAAYGLSLALFVVGLRALGTARTGAYFAVAPFFGALLSLVLLGDPLTPQLLVAGGLMGLGVWLHLSEQHAHDHHHAAAEHDHWHRHDDGHHEHEHAEQVPLRGHRHSHAHPELRHAHPHTPDAHHRHAH